MLPHLAQLNFQTVNIIKAALKIEASVANAITYYIFHQLKAMCRYC